MKKILNQRIVIASVAAFVFMIIVVFAVLSTVMVNNAKDTVTARIADVEDRINLNDVEIAALTEQLNTDYILKADIFAEIIRINPSIINNSAKLFEIRDMLNVDELHVTDENGIIYWGTIPEYFGFDFSTSDQTREFLPILNDPTLKIAQNPQPNGAEGKMFQYISVPRTDKKGIVQVGLTPERLTSAIEANSIANVLKTYTIGNNGYVFAVSKTDNTIAAHKNAALIGKPAADAGINEKMLKVGFLGFKKIDGENVYCASGENSDYIIIAAIPKNEVYNGRAVLLILFMLAIVIMIGVIIFLINSVTQNIIINGMDEILRDVNIISNGNLEITVAVNNCPEYTMLSDGINSMINSIKRNLKKTIELNEEQKNLFDKINSISAGVGIHSGNMKEMAKKLSDGSALQATTVKEISDSTASILKQIKASAKAAKNAKNISDRNMERITKGSEKLKNLEEAMSRIQKYSNKIGKIVRTIEEISFQTNILALNAAVEAASAGEYGKGFAVVADDVRALAAKSTEATDGTAELIENTMLAVSEGVQLTQETVQHLKDMSGGVSENNKLIDNISSAAEQEEKAFIRISESINQISQVAQQNANISYNAETTSQRMDEETRSLQQLFQNK